MIKLNSNRALSFREAMDYLQVSKSWLYKMTSQRKIPHSKPNGGKIYFKEQELIAWMLSNEVKSVTEVLNETVSKSNRNGK